MTTGHATSANFSLTTGRFDRWSNRQDPVLFCATIAANIAYANEAATQAEVRRPPALVSLIEANLNQWCRAESTVSH